MRGWSQRRRACRLLSHCLGGSFGTVYKAIEKETGEVVAIKHVSDCVGSMSRPIRLIGRTRSTSSPARMTFKKSSKKSPSLPHAPVPT